MPFSIVSPWLAMSNSGHRATYQPFSPFSIMAVSCFLISSTTPRAAFCASADVLMDVQFFLPEGSGIEGAWFSASSVGNTLATSGSGAPYWYPFDRSHNTYRGTLCRIPHGDTAECISSNLAFFINIPLSAGHGPHVHNPRFLSNSNSIPLVSPLIPSCYFTSFSPCCRMPLGMKDRKDGNV